MTERIQLTVAQAVVKFLPRQYSERDGVQQRLIEGCFGIFGHGNIVGLGQALMQHEAESGRLAEASQDGDVDRDALRYFQCRNAGHGAHRCRLRPDAQPLADREVIVMGATGRT